VAIEAEPGLPTLYLDKSQLESAILNLVCNSRDAMPTGGHVRITAAMQRISDPSVPEAGPRTCAVLHYQARRTGQRTGAEPGVRVTTQSGGFPLLTSEPGKGTAITLCFPVSEP